MSAQGLKPIKHIAALLAAASLIAVVVWLAQGSSNQARSGSWAPIWQNTESFHYARRAPAAVAHRGYLYVIGGINGRDEYVSTVEYAPIHENGLLGQWRTTSMLQQGRFYNSAVAVGDYLYTLGGGAGPTGYDNYPVTTVERARIQADGSLGEWQLMPELLTARRGLKNAFFEGWIYAIGGYDGQFLKSIERAQVLADGSLSPWQMEQHESHIDRYIHSSAIYRDRLYLLGGHMRDPAASYGDVESSRIQNSGALSQWQIEKHPLQISRLVAESFVLGKFLYIAGGHTGGERLTSVEVSRLSADGDIGPWQQTTALPRPRSAFAVATHGRHVYVLGGGGDNGPLSSVDVASANGQGKLGWAISPLE